MNTEEKIGEDGISINDTDQATRYNNYQVYLDLLEIGYTEAEAAVQIGTAAYVELLKKEFGGV